MKKITNKHRILIVLSFLFISVYKTEATAITYTWIGTTSTDWQTASNWSASSGNSYPSLSTDTVIIASATNQPIASSTHGTNIYSMASLTLNTGTNLTFSFDNLFVTGNITLNSGSTLTYSGGAVSGSVSGNLTGSGTFVGGSTGFEVDGAFSVSNFTANTSTIILGGNINLGAYTFDNLTINGSIALTGDIVVSGSLTGTGTLSPGSHNISVGTSLSISNLTTGTGSSTITTTQASCIIGAAYTFNNLTINNTTNLTADIVINGNLAGSSTFKPFTHAFPNLGHNFSVGGSMTVATLNVGTGSCTCTLNGTSQTINGGYTFNGLVVNSGTGTTFTGDVTVSGSLSGLGTLIGGSSNIITVNGTFSVSNFTANTSTVILGGTSNLGAYTFDNLTINGIATLTGNLIVNGNLAGSGTLIPGSYNVTVYGNTTINSITTGTGTTTITGTSPSVNSQTFYNLTISNTTAALSGNVTVNGTLTLSSGILTLGSYKLTIASGGSISGYSSSSYIYTNGSGKLEITVTTSGATFYIGDDFNPITITPSGTATFDVSVSNGITENDGSTQLPDYSVNRTWTISCPGSSTSITVTPQWDNNTDLCIDGHYDLTHAFVAYRDITHTNTWTPSASSDMSSEPDPTQYTVSSGAIPIPITMGDQYNIGVGLGTASALPVTFMDLNAILNLNNAVLLNWQTASEINNDYFGIERSLDGASWQTTGQVGGHGNSQVLESYAFTDNLQGIVPNGVIYYRLKQVDYNGKFEYSEIKSVNIEINSASLETYPNPAGNILNINWTNADNGNVILKLINTNGSPVFTQNVSGQGLKSNQIDLSNFASGTYLLQIVSDKDVISKVVYKE